MLAPSAFPEWLPPSVKIEAERILGSGHADEALVLRLATDRRMQRVWRELAKHKQPDPKISEAWATLMNGRVDVPLPQDDPDALALFFWVAYTIKSLGIRTTTYPRLDVPISQYKLVAAQLRLSAVTLLGLNLQFGEVIEGAYQTSDVHTDQAEQAAAFCDEIAATLIQLKAAEAPLIVKRNYGSREARGYVRMLAIESRSLFGKTLLRTLATVGSVALMKDVKAGQVRNWCGSLD